MNKEQQHVYPASGYTVIYTTDVDARDADDAEEAAAEVYRRMTSPRGFRAMFAVRDNDTGTVSTIDLEHV